VLHLNRKALPFIVPLALLVALMLVAGALELPGAWNWR